MAAGGTRTTSKPRTCASGQISHPRLPRPYGQSNNCILDHLQHKVSIVMSNDKVRTLFPRERCIYWEPVAVATRSLLFGIRSASHVQFSAPPCPEPPARLWLPKPFHGLSIAFAERHLPKREKRIPQTRSQFWFDPCPRTQRPQARALFQVGEAEKGRQLWCWRYQTDDW